MGAESDSDAPRSSKRHWLHYLLAALVPFALVCLWRSPAAAAWRPAIVFGSSWGDIARAWIPEGLLFGIACLLAQRVFSTRRGFPSITACLLHLALWMPVWVLGVVVSGATVLDGFAGHIGPLKDVLRAGGLMGGILAGGMALVYAMICVVVVAFELAVAALWSGQVAPAMTRIAAGAKAGSVSADRAGPAFGAVMIAGAAFWGVRLTILGTVEEPLWRGVLDAGATMAIIGMAASSMAWPAASATPPPISPGGPQRS